MKIENDFPVNLFFPAFDAYKIATFQFGGIQYHAWETGDGIAVISMQDCYFPGFSIPQLFRCEHSKFPAIISSAQFSTILSLPS